MHFSGMNSILEAIENYETNNVNCRNANSPWVHRTKGSYNRVRFSLKTFDREVLNVLAVLCRDPCLE